MQVLPAGHIVPEHAACPEHRLAMLFVPHATLPGSIEHAGTHAHEPPVHENPDAHIVPEHAGPPEHRFGMLFVPHATLPGSMEHA